MSFDFGAYVSACENELGPAPAMATCIEGEDLPFTYTDSSGVKKVLSRADLKETVLWEDVDDINTQEVIQCDEPSLIIRDLANGGCFPDQKVVRKDTEFKGAKVTWIGVCLKTHKATTQHKNWFDDVGYIGYNEKTGAACFFQGRHQLDPSGRKAVPGDIQLPTTRLVESTKPWKALVERDDCVRCHASGPWLHTPLVDNVVNSKTGERVMPSEKRLGKLPYKIVFQKELQAAAGPDKWDPKVLSVPKSHPAAFCTSCHSIGFKDYCRRYIQTSILTKPVEKKLLESPHSKAWNDHPYWTEAIAEIYFRNLSPESKNLSKSGWHNSLVGLREKDGTVILPKSVESALNAVNKCCWNEEQDPMCRWEGYP
jgi:hypothetical protein